MTTEGKVEKVIESIQLALAKDPDYRKMNDDELRRRALNRLNSAKSDLENGIRILEKSGLLPETDDIFELKEAEKLIEDVSIVLDNVQEKMIWLLRKRLEDEKEYLDTDPCEYCGAPYMVSVGDDEKRGCSC